MITIGLLVLAYLITILRRVIARLTRPSVTEIVEGILLDVVRSKPNLIAENTLLRQQLIILQRSVRIRASVGVTD